MPENVHQGYASKMIPKVSLRSTSLFVFPSYETPVGVENFLFIYNFSFSKIIGVWDLKDGHGKTLRVFIYKTLSTRLPINCGKTITWDGNSLFSFFENSNNPLHKLWQNYHLKRKFPFLNLLPPVSIFFCSRLARKKLWNRRRRRQQMLGSYFAFLPLIYGKDCRQPSSWGSNSINQL